MRERSLCSDILGHAPDLWHFPWFEDAVRNTCLSGLDVEGKDNLVFVSIKGLPRHIAMTLVYLNKRERTSERHGLMYQHDLCTVAIAREEGRSFAP